MNLAAEAELRLDDETQMIHDVFGLPLMVAAPETLLILLVMMISLLFLSP